jgi:hypothetical protein
MMIVDDMMFFCFFYYFIFLFSSFGNLSLFLHVVLNDYLIHVIGIRNEQKV